MSLSQCRHDGVQKPAMDDLALAHLRAIFSTITLSKLSIACSIRILGRAWSPRTGFNYQFQASGILVCMGDVPVEAHICLWYENENFVP